MVNLFDQISVLLRALRPWRCHQPFHLRRGLIASSATEFLRNHRLEDLVQSEALQRLKDLDNKRWVKGLDIARAIVNLFDQISVLQGKFGWVEKTPRNLYYCDLISESAPDARFVHIARNGRDAVASYVAAAPKWTIGPRWISPARSARLWNADMKRSLRYAKHPMHHLVTYEDLAQRPEKVINRLVEQLSLPFDLGLLSRYQETAKRVVRPDETWKQLNVKGIQKQSTFNQVLNGKERDKVERILNPRLYEQFKRVIQVKRGA
jgi:hypothetical protein